ncbi:AAA family ATPase [Dyadobacter sp. BHUBP1]|uniref:AAA family ATPase n=1 Tax=Dyadobacter sp. BHUBP1 TaxID=3424178 RepID=UPI003D326F68
MNSEPHSASYHGIDFVDTKEYKRFVEFTEACMEYRYIGICYGEPGVGKSFAAEHYLNWDDQIVVSSFVEHLPSTIIEKVENCRGVLMIAPVVNSPKIVQDRIKRGIEGFGVARDRMRGETNIVTLIYDAPKLCPLVVVDEADRLDIKSLEQLRGIQPIKCIFLSSGHLITFGKNITHYGSVGRNVQSSKAMA